MAEATYGKRAHPLLAFINDLDEIMWTELSASKPVDIYRRNLQRAYVDKLIDWTTAASGRDTRDMGPIVRHKLEEIQRRINRAIPKVKDDMTLYHLKFIEERVRQALAR